MTTHPYAKLPASSYWRSAVSDIPAADIDPVVAAPFAFSTREGVVTAGSCFAQHIGRYLKSSGCNYLVTEQPHEFLGADAALALNFGVYSARYGNVYTSRQLLQLFDRAYGDFVPAENYWPGSQGVVVDPFRPQIQPGAFNSARELDHDRERHFRAVREAFETLDVFIFTLGLTEAWRSRADGAVYPLCPGVAGGEYAPSRHEFVNFGADDVVADVTAFVDRLRKVNPKAKVILTVSPVPLVATAEKRHVLVSTVLSKSVLRVACDVLTRSLPDVAYFPSYEIVANAYGGQDFFEADRRSVTKEGVAHVMRIFERHFVKRNFAEQALGALRTLQSASRKDNAVAAALKLMCDEEALTFSSIAGETPPGEPERSDNEARQD